MCGPRNDVSSNSLDHVNPVRMLNPFLKRRSILPSPASYWLVPLGFDSAIPLELNIAFGERSWLKLMVELLPSEVPLRAGMPLNGFGTGWFHVNVATGLPLASNVGVWYCFHNENGCSFSNHVPKFQMP